MKIVNLIFVLSLLLNVSAKDILTVKVSGSKLRFVEGLNVNSVVEIGNVRSVAEIMYFLESVDKSQEYKPLHNLSALHLDLEFANGLRVTIIGNDLLVINRKFYISKNTSSILRCIFTHLIVNKKLRWSK